MRLAASTADRLFPTISFWTRSKIFSPSLGVSGRAPFAPASILSITEAGSRPASSYRPTISRHSPKVELSGTVGPEAITSRGSPTTSDRIRVTTVAGQQALASCPPLTLDRCFLTVLISSMDAPQASSSDVVACFSSRVMPSAGATSRADPPPEITQKTRSLSPARLANLDIPSAP